MIGMTDHLTPLPRTEQTTADLSPLMGSALVFNQEDSFRVSVCWSIYTEGLL